MSETTIDHVAEHATLAAILPMNGLTIIGIFNTHDGPAALLRSSHGQIERVTPGAEALGVSIVAIGPDIVKLRDHAGALHTLAVPGS